MRSVDWDVVRLFLHVLGATVWVGGQLTLAGLVPALRAAGATVPAVAARRFALLAWPAYVLLLGTGAWNVVAERDRLHGAFQHTLTAKISVVVLSGVAAYAHQRARARWALGVWGALSGLSALGALFLGALLQH